MMVELSVLFGDIENQKIAFFVYDVGRQKSVTIELNRKYAIFMDPFRMGTIQQLKRALSHELGHCATGCTHKVSSPLDLVEKHEYKANRWAIERYIPFDALCGAIKAGYTEKWQLAEYFDLPESSIERALTYYFETKGMKIK